MLNAFLAEGVSGLCFVALDQAVVWVANCTSGVPNIEKKAKALAGMCEIVQQVLLNDVAVPEATKLASAVLATALGKQPTQEMMAEGTTIIESLYDRDIMDFFAVGLSAVESAITSVSRAKGKGTSAYKTAASAETDGTPDVQTLPDKRPVGEIIGRHDRN